MSTFPYAAATGVGSLPGTDPHEAIALVVDELPLLPHLPELPARGPGADLSARTGARLLGLNVDLQPSGWRLVDRPGRDQRRALSWLDEDLDAVEEATQGYTGAFKVQLTGPHTLAATLELPRGEKALADPGARRDLAASLAETVTDHLAEVRRRIPGAELVLQLDEPALPHVLGGLVPTASGYQTLRALHPPEVSAALRLSLEAARAAGARTVVHCCADDLPIALLREAGTDAISFDARLLDGGRLDDELGLAVEAGTTLFLGLVPAVAAGPTGAAVPAQSRGSSRSRGSDRGSEPELSGAAATVGPVRTLRDRLGLDAEQLAGAVVVTPSCGLAGATPAYARSALRLCREAARILSDDPEG